MILRGDIVVEVEDGGREREVRVVQGPVLEVGVGSPMRHRDLDPMMRIASDVVPPSYVMEELCTVSVPRFHFSLSPLRV